MSQPRGLSERFVTSHDGPDAEAHRWLLRFHAGDTAVMNDLYREHFDTVRRVVERLLSGVDAETVLHDVFLRLMSRADVRRSFQGGSLPAWLSTLARNQALDVLRRRQRESNVLSRLAEEAGSEEAWVEPATSEPALDAANLLERFRREVLPAKWAPVFEARFLRQLSQREAAQELRMNRTTLAYQELRVRNLLKNFLLSSEAR